MTRKNTAFRSEQGTRAAEATFDPSVEAQRAVLKPRMDVFGNKISLR